MWDKTWEEMDNKELIALQNAINKELQRRKDKTAQTAIDNFKKAFIELVNAGVEVYYETWEEVYPLQDTTQLRFDY
jgi:hypothetical protein